MKWPQKTRFKRNKCTVCQPVSGHRVVFELPCFSAASLPLLPALVVHSFQLVQPQKCQLPNQRPSWGQVVLSPTSALVLWGFCESSRTETCSAERVPGLGESLGHSSSAEGAWPGGVPIALRGRLAWGSAWVTALSSSLQAHHTGTPGPPPPPLGAPPDPLPASWSLVTPIFSYLSLPPIFPSPGNFE